MNSEKMKTASAFALVAVQLAGVILSALLISVTYMNRQQVEERVQRFAVAKVEQAADSAWRAAERADESRSGRLKALSQKLGIDADRVDERRKQIVPALLAEALSARCAENCGFWVAAAAVTNSAMVQQAAKLRVGQGTLQEFVLERYETTVKGLIADLRHFGMVNLIALALMIGLVVFRKRLNWRFTAFSIAVTANTAWAAYGYFYNQNWALTILTQDWAAPGYQAGMIFMCCLFADWLFLDGAITKAVINAIMSMLPG